MTVFVEQPLVLPRSAKYLQCETDLFVCVYTLHPDSPEFVTSNSLTYPSTSQGATLPLPWQQRIAYMFLPQQTQFQIPQAPPPLAPPPP